MRRFILILFFFFLSVLTVSSQDSLAAELLSRKGVSNPAIREVFLKVPHTSFVNVSSERYRNTDIEIPLTEGGFIIRPSLALSCLLYLEPLPGDKCLVVGKGSAYLAALLSGICSEVYVIEENEQSIPEYEEKMKAFSTGTLSVSGPDTLMDILNTGPYDLILIAGATMRIPDTITHALVTGGTLLAPLMEPGGFQMLIKITKTDIGYDYRALTDCFFPVMKNINP